MKISGVLIKNFKKFKHDNNEWIDFTNVNFLIGENNSGKTTILEAIDMFFNQDKFDSDTKEFINDANKNVEISIKFDNDENVTKTFECKTFKAKFDKQIKLPSYIYLKANDTNFEKHIKEITIAKAKSKKSFDDSQKRIENLLNETFREIIDNSNKEILIGAGGKGLSDIIINDSKLDLEKSFKIDHKPQGIELTSYGLGTQKSFIYSLLLGNEIKNTIIAIDELENSMSLNNCKYIIEVLRKKDEQLLITTHSVEVLEEAKNNEIIPIYSNEKKDEKTIPNLYKKLGMAKKDKLIVFVEGKNDIPYFEKAFELVFKNDFKKYWIQKLRGADTIKSFIAALNQTKDSENIIGIIDGDGKPEGENKNKNLKILDKKCIEYYFPKEKIKEVLGSDFSWEEILNDPYKKTRLSQNAKKNINETNELVEWVKNNIPPQGEN